MITAHLFMPIYVYIYTSIHLYIYTYIYTSIRLYGGHSYSTYARMGGGGGRPKSVRGRTRGVGVSTEQTIKFSSLIYLPPFNYFLPFSHIRSEHFLPIIIYDVNPHTATRREQKKIKSTRDSETLDAMNHNNLIITRGCFIGTKIFALSGRIRSLAFRGIFLIICWLG